MSISSIDEIREQMDLPPWGGQIGRESVVFTNEGPIPVSMAPDILRHMQEGYVTKDSGKRQEYSTGMKRDINESKPRFDLILAKDMPYEEQFLTRWAKLMERGAVKYGERNWEKAGTQEELDRFGESAFRHLLQWLSGEDDEDHAAAVVFNLAGAEYVKWKLRSESRS